MLSQFIGLPFGARFTHPVVTTGRTKLPKATGWYVCQLIERYLREHPDVNNVRLAELTGQTKQHIGSIRAGKANPGTDLAIAVAGLFGLTLDELKVEAQARFDAEVKGDDGPTVEPLERYPNRAAVLALLRADLDPEVVTRVQSRALASPSDPSKLWWIRTVLQETEAVKLERENPLAVAAARAESEALSDDVNAKIEAHRAKGPKRARR